jgi:hypothetical protein
LLTEKVLNEFPVGMMMMCVKEERLLRRILFP